MAMRQTTVKMECVYQCYWIVVVESQESTATFDQTSSSQNTVTQTLRQYQNYQDISTHLFQRGYILQLQAAPGMKNRNLNKRYIQLKHAIVNTFRRRTKMCTKLQLVQFTMQLPSSSPTQSVHVTAFTDHLGYQLSMCFLDQHRTWIWITFMVKNAPPKQLSQQLSRYSPKKPCNCS